VRDGALIARWASEAVVAAKEAGGREVEDSALRIIESRKCRHQATTIERATRTVKCQGCGAKLDPFWVLLEYANHERVFSNTTLMAKMDRDRLRQQVEELKKERARLQGQVRRGRKP
jgi:ribosomal protein S27E